MPSFDWAIVPMILVGGAAGAACGAFRRWWLGAVAAALCTVLIAYAGFWAVIALVGSHGNQVRPWDLFVTAYLSAFALPAAMVGFSGVRFLRARKANHAI